MYLSVWIVPVIKSNTTRSKMSLIVAFSEHGTNDTLNALLACYLSALNYRQRSSSLSPCLCVYATVNSILITAFCSSKYFPGDALWNAVLKSKEIMSMVCFLSSKSVNLQKRQQVYLADLHFLNLRWLLSHFLFTLSSIADSFKMFSKFYVLTKSN